jgi:peptidoglycan L-alanyl-D-glutamate endopeptidase CwlK
VNQQLVEVVHIALSATKVDFGVIEGVRTATRQTELVKSGASQTMNSKHLTGHAVDLMAYIGNRASWELNLYEDIAEAVKIGAQSVGVPVIWGAAWHIRDIRYYNKSMSEALTDYVDLRRSQGRRPFIDGPHFELA